MLANLSFGPNSREIDLMPLNVIIGPNGSGKSNLIKIIQLLKSVPIDLNEFLRVNSNSVEEWSWAGKSIPPAELHFKFKEMQIN